MQTGSLKSTRSSALLEAPLPGKAGHWGGAAHFCLSPGDCCEAGSCTPCSPRTTFLTRALVQVQCAAQ